MIQHNLSDDLSGLAAEERKRRSVRAHRSAGRVEAQHNSVERADGDAAAKDAEVGFFAVQHGCQGNSPAKWRGRLEFSC